MALVSTRVDDLDGTGEASPVTFSLDGTTYEIDLSDDNVVKLRSDLARYIQVARARSMPVKKKATIDKAQLDAIRRWARDHGYEFSDRGRIPNRVMEDYQKLAARNTSNPRFSSV